MLGLLLLYAFVYQRPLLSFTARIKESETRPEKAEQKSRNQNPRKCPETWIYSPLLIEKERLSGHQEAEGVS